MYKLFRRLTQKTENYPKEVDASLNFASSVSIPESNAHDETPQVHRFAISVGKNPMENEDAQPICLIQDNKGVIGVFDGMGGAGSTIYHSKDGESHTGAYFASRIVRDLIEQHFDYLQGQWGGSVSAKSLNDLKQILVGHLQKMLSEFEKNPSRIKSNLSKKLPTTLATVYFTWNSHGKVEVDVVWAGDSRAYLLDVDGLHQVSIDDVKSLSGGLSDLTQDAPLSNCISADNDFELRHQFISTNLPLILFVATDGCYGYVNTPAHFEHLILDTLLRSNDEQEWAKQIENRLKPIAGDDFSMALVCLGWKKFLSIKEYFRPRMTKINQIIHPLDEILSRIQGIDMLIENLKGEKESLVAEKKDIYNQFWDSYKLIYERYLRGE